METKANYLMIGAFVLGVLAFAFIFVFWMSNFTSGGKSYYVVFQSSVAGLTSGSSVAFNGINIGEVQSFALDPEDDRKVRVLINVRDDIPIRENSRASIHSLGLTGGSGIQITPGTPDAPLLIASGLPTPPATPAPPPPGAGAHDPPPTSKSAPGAGRAVLYAGPCSPTSANAL